MKYTHNEGVSVENNRPLLATLSAGIAALLITVVALLQTVSAATSSTVTVTGDTATAENQPGWLFNRDAGNATPIEFTTTQSKIGLGSLYVKPIGTTAAQKFVGENFINKSIADVESISFDFKIGSGGTALEDTKQFYMNIYANFAESDDLKYFDCRYDVVATVGSTNGWSTVTFDPTKEYPVFKRTGSAAPTQECPPKPIDMDISGLGSNIRMFSLNVGDTTTSDAGLNGYLDNVVVSFVNGVMTTHDFERYVTATGEIISPTPGQEVSGTLNLAATYNDGDVEEDDAVQWAVRKGTCEASKGTVAGNVDGEKDSYTLWDGANFSATLDVSGYTPGEYCFVFNPTDEPGQNNVRETVTFKIISMTAGTKDDCKNNRWAIYGVNYKNQGQCVASIVSNEKSKLNR